jgi:hypothetical protein
MKRLISVVVASALMATSTGSALAHKAKRGHKHRAAQHYVQHPYAYNHHNVRPRKDNGAAALAFGLFAIGTIAALAASKNGNVNVGYGHQYAPQPYPAAPYGYGPAGYGYGPSGYGYAPPPPVEYEREKIVEYRREYERVRQVGY